MVPAYFHYVAGALGTSHRSNITRTCNHDGVAKL